MLCCYSDGHGPCTTATDCCNMDCNEVDGGGSICCQTSGNACTEDGQCCSGTCTKFGSPLKRNRSAYASFLASTSRCQ